MKKLKYKAIEEERKKRILEFVITHLAIDTNMTNLDRHVKDFFGTYMKFERRSLDENLVAEKISRSNTFIIRFSDRRSKVFWYSTKKEASEERLLTY